MNAARAALGLLCWPLAHLWGFGVATLTSLLDLVATPWVAMRRAGARWPDDPPATRNASVIVLNYDGRHYLERLLPSLRTAVERAPGDHEILVVDNGSGDGSADWVEAHFPDVRLVRLPENRFFIRGNRAGVEAATRDVLVFVNNDMVVEPDFLARLLDRFGAGDVFAVTSRIDMQGKRVETGRTRLSFRRGALHFVQTDGPDADEIPALWAGGGSSAFDRRKLEALGGFEDLYEPCYVEDVSLSYRAWRRGWRVLYEPRSGVLHAHQATSSRVFTPGQRARIVLRNRELFFWRCFTSPRMVWGHALWLPWNLMKRAGQDGFGNQLAALALATARLPAAWRGRQRTRIHARRTDDDVLRIANHVRRHREAVRHDGGGRKLRVLSVGAETDSIFELPGVDIEHRTISMPEVDHPSGEARSRGAPRWLWRAIGQGPVSDALRDALSETDHDVVVFRDFQCLVATPPDLRDDKAVLLHGSWQEALRAEPFPAGMKPLLEALRWERANDPGLPDLLRSLG